MLSWNIFNFFLAIWLAMSLGLGPGQAFACGWLVVWMTPNV